MQVCRRWIETRVDAQRAAFGQALAQLLLHGAVQIGVAVLDAAHEGLHLIFDRRFRRCHLEILSILNWPMYPVKAHGRSAPTS